MIEPLIIFIETLIIFTETLIIFIETLIMLTETLTMLNETLTIFNHTEADSPATPMAGLSIILYPPQMFTHSSLHDEIHYVRFLPMTVAQLLFHVNDPLVEVGDDPDQLFDLLLGPAELMLDLFHPYQVLSQGWFFSKGGRGDVAEFRDPIPSVRRCGPAG
ncbi:hypothetical protein M3557_04710 [Bhargavaea ginsengi]|uniref:hypothetical protein n=1 Tax=Bhargavaea ginsengi TaxID=426757 RepID=UPI002041B9A6|nr:hypothetical protein [Bhargavaea ginsengi]MCM3087210.1 hypothetical protein [Bhargavaea ginsengi]